MRTLISGGRSDIGRALIERRLSKGDTVLTTTSQTEQPLSFSKPVDVMAFNLAKPEENSEAVQSWIDQGVDALILNAATRNTSLRRLHEYDKDEIISSFQENVMGNIWLLQKCLKKMSEQKFGRVLFISSMTVQGASRYGLYSASKGAIESLIRGVATDYGEFNINANIIRPSVVETERTKRFWKRSAYVDVMKPLIPLMRFAQPQDIAVASDMFLETQCYANGATLDLSGGFPQFRPDSLFKVGL